MWLISNYIFFSFSNMPVVKVHYDQRSLKFSKCLPHAVAQLFPCCALCNIMTTYNK